MRVAVVRCALALAFMAVASALPTSKFALKHQQQLSALQSMRQSDPTALTVGGVAVAGAIGHGNTVTVSIPKIADGANANVPFALTASQMQNTAVDYNVNNAGWHNGHPAAPVANIVPFNVPIPWGQCSVVLRLTHGGVQRTLTVTVTREATQAEVCAVILANIGAGNHNAVVIAALNQLGDGRPLPTQNVCQMRPIVAYRNVAAYAAVCDAVGIDVDYQAAMRGTAASVARPAMQFALEEEMVTIRLTQSTLPDDAHGSIGSTTLCKSAAAPLPPVAYLKLDVDHITADNGESWNVLEVVTGPMNTLLANHAIHRNVVGHVTASVPTGFFSWKRAIGPFATAGTVAHTLNTALNGAGGAYANYAINTNVYGSIADVKAKRYTNGQRNNIQVNYDVSICALHNGNAFGGAFDAMFGTHAFAVRSLALLTRLRLASTAYVNNHAVFTLARRNTLPDQQKCELYGLFTMFMYQMVGKQITTEQQTMPHPHPFYHPGGTYKNFWEQMVKTNVWNVVQALSYPLAGLVREWYVAAAAAPLVTATAIVTAAKAQMVLSPDAWVVTYGGSAPAAVYITGAFWQPYLTNFDVRTLANAYVPTSMNGRTAPAGDAPPAFRVRAHGAMHDEVCVVVESRDPGSVVNSALSDNPPVGGAAITAANSILRVAAAQASYQAGNAIADFVAAC